MGGQTYLLSAAPYLFSYFVLYLYFLAGFVSRVGQQSNDLFNIPLKSGIENVHGSLGAEAGKIKEGACKFFLSICMQIGRGLGVQVVTITLLKSFYAFSVLYSFSFLFVFSSLYCLSSSFSMLKGQELGPFFFCFCCRRP